MAGNSPEHEPSPKPKVPSNHEHQTDPQQGLPQPCPRPQPETEAGPPSPGTPRSGPTSHVQPLPGLEGFPAGFELSQVLISASYSGPITGAQLAEYEQVVPGSAEKILEHQFYDPQRRITMLTQKEVATAERGQGWAIFFVMVSMIAAIVFFALANPYAGSAFLGMPLVMLIRLLIPDMSRKQPSEPQPDTPQG